MRARAGPARTRTIALGGSDGLPLPGGAGKPILAVPGSGRQVFLPSTPARSSVADSNVNWCRTASSRRDLFPAGGRALTPPLALSSCPAYPGACCLGVAPVSATAERPRTVAGPFVALKWRSVSRAIRVSLVRPDNRSGDPQPHRLRWAALVIANRRAIPRPAELQQTVPGMPRPAPPGTSRARSRAIRAMIRRAPWCVDFGRLLAERPGSVRPSPSRCWPMPPWRPPARREIPSARPLMIRSWCFGASPDGTTTSSMRPAAAEHRAPHRCDGCPIAVRALGLPTLPLRGPST